MRALRRLLTLVLVVFLTLGGALAGAQQEEWTEDDLKVAIAIALQRMQTEVADPQDPFTGSPATPLEGAFGLTGVATSTLLVAGPVVPGLVGAGLTADAIEVVSAGDPNYLASVVAVPIAVLRTNQDPCATNGYNELTLVFNSAGRAQLVAQEGVVVDPQTGGTEIVKIFCVDGQEGLVYAQAADDGSGIDFALPYATLAFQLDGQYHFAVFGLDARAGAWGASATAGNDGVLSFQRTSETDFAFDTPITLEEVRAAAGDPAIEAICDQLAGVVPAVPAEPAAPPTSDEVGNETGQPAQDEGGGAAQEQIETPANEPIAGAPADEPTSPVSPEGGGATVILIVISGVVVIAIVILGLRRRRSDRGPTQHATALPGVESPSSAEVGGGRGPDRGAIEGTVTGSEGYGLPGARIRLGDRTARSDASGHFEFRDVPVGTHAVSAELEGFSKVTRSGVVEAGANARVDFIMRLASSVEDVVATGGAPMLDEAGGRSDGGPGPDRGVIEGTEIEYYRDFPESLDTLGVSFRGVHAVPAAGVARDAQQEAIYEFTFPPSGGEGLLGAVPSETRLWLPSHHHVGAMSLDLETLRFRGTELREAFGDAHIEPEPSDISTEGFYHFAFRHTEMEPDGSYVSVNDFATKGSGFLGFGVPVILGSPGSAHLDNSNLDYESGDIWSAPLTVTPEFGARSVPWGEIGFGGDGTWQFAGSDLRPSLIVFGTDSSEVDLPELLESLDVSAFDEHGRAVIDTSFGAVGGRVMALGPAGHGAWAGLEATYQSGDRLLVAGSISYRGADVLDGQLTAAQLFSTARLQLQLSSQATAVALDMTAGDPGDPSQQGQFGLALRYFDPELNQTEFGFYWAHLHSRLPILPARDLGGDGGVRSEGDTSHAIDPPREVDDAELLFSVLTPVERIVETDDGILDNGPGTYTHQDPRFTAVGVGAVPETDGSVFVQREPGSVWSEVSLGMLTRRPDGTWRGPDRDGHDDEWVLLPTGFLYESVDGELPNLFEVVEMLPRIVLGETGLVEVDTSAGPGILRVNRFDAFQVPFGYTPPRLTAAIAYPVFFSGDHFNQRNDRDFISLTSRYSF